MPFDLIKSGARPIAAAVAKLGDKSVVASTLRTAEWEGVPLALRERAFFSAGVEQADFLSTAQGKIQSALQLQKEQLANGSEAYVDRSSFIGDMRKLAQDSGLSTETNTLTDLASRARLKLIYDMQTQQAFNFARWKTDQDPDLLDAYPAQELVRVESRQTQRDWASRWSEAGGELVAGRMVALKNNPIWTDISRFETPWPPYDFGSGMGLKDISRTEAEDLGLLTAEDTVQPGAIDFNDSLEASLANLEPGVVDALTTVFGNLIEISGQTLKWVGGAA
jgi:hypothetical protein